MARSWDRRRKQEENRAAELSALQESHRRVVVALVEASAICRERAEEGDSLAKLLVQKLDAAWDGLAAENIGANDFARTSAYAERGLETTG